MRVKTDVEYRTGIDEDLTEDLWKLYDAAFHELNALAVQRHLMYRHEFDAVMTDEGIRKYLAVDRSGDGPVIRGLATFTNHLDRWPLIAPEYFERRWPDLYAEGKIWYCGFVCVPPGAHGMPSDAYQALIETMYKAAIAEGGLVVLDFCAHNGDKRRMRTSIPAALGRISPGSQAVCLDAQEFWAYIPPTTEVGAR